PVYHRDLHSFPTRRSSDLMAEATGGQSSPLSGFSSTAHIMGTARMGTDPTNSVVDPYGRVWGVDNLLVADGSVFVSAGGFNPTLDRKSTRLNSSHQIISYS